MKKAFLVVMMLVIPILSFGAEPQMDNIKILTELAIGLGLSQDRLLSGLTVLLVLQFLGGVFIIASIMYWFNKKLEKFRFEFRVREQAAGVAELLAEARGGPTENIKKLNKLTWEVSLWLPPELVRELTRQLCYHEDSKPVLLWFGFLSSCEEFSGSWVSSS